jgi:CHAT domain-containing protein
MSKPAARRHQALRSSSGRGVHATALVCLALALLWLGPDAHPPPAAGAVDARAALAARLGPIRPLPGRLTGGFEYRPLELVVEVTDFLSWSRRPPSIDASRIRDAARWVRSASREYERRPAPQALADKALAILLGDRLDKAERAVPLLEEAVAEAPGSAQLWSDLAAVYLFDTRPPSRDLLAVAAADRALRENPALVEARFNLALALEQCGLRQEARRAWESYLRFDGESGWAHEARSHLKQLGAAASREARLRPWQGRHRSGGGPSHLPPGADCRLLRSMAKTLAATSPHAALYLLDEGLEAAAEIEDPSVRIELLAERSRLEELVGDGQAAKRDLGELERTLAAFRDGIRKPGLKAEEEVARCRSRLIATPRDCLPALTAAIDYLRGHDPAALPEVYRLRAAVFHELGDAAAEEADLRRGIELYEHAAGNPSAERQAFEGREARELFARMTAFLLSRGDFRRALELAERGRAIATGQLYSTADALLGALPGHTTLVEYAVLGDRLAIWTAGRGRIDFSSVRMDRRQLESLIEQWRTSIRGGQAEREESLAEALHRCLIEPVRRFLPSSGDLVIVPDEMLVRVPFAALRSSPTHRYLVETFSVSVSSSASLYLQQLARHPVADHRRWRALAVTNAKLVDPPSAALPGADAEASEVLRIFPGPETTSRGPGPMAEGPQPEIVHFAGHGSGRTNSRLGPDNLTVGHDVRLLILSACGTSGLAGSYLSRGVPAVVASLWQIDDAATAPFFLSFYRHLRAGADGANALRAAQLERLHATASTLRAPEHWAGFQLLGFGGI